MRRSPTKGFSLVELLVVIAIIGTLSTIAIVALNRARVLARETTAKADVRAIANAINLLAADTGKWPNGCPIETVANPEVYLLSGAQAGLLTAPVVGDQGSGCTWNAVDIANWRGPYIGDLLDPWGNSYYFDPDYVPYQSCPSQGSGVQTVVVVSFGPNKVGPNAYDCDDIFFQMR